MTTIADLILDLQHASGPARGLDMTVGKILGYQRILKPKGNRDVAYWVNPQTKREGSLPYFTANIDSAKICAELLLPKSRGGYTWNSIYATARIDDGPIVSSTLR